MQHSMHTCALSLMLLCCHADSQKKLHTHTYNTMCGYIYNHTHSLSVSLSLSLSLCVSLSLLLCMYMCMHVHAYVCMYVCIYVCMHVEMYVCVLLVFLLTHALFLKHTDITLAASGTRGININVCIYARMYIHTYDLCT